MNDPLLGRVLDNRYEIQARLGEGGMGVVYKARQVSVDRPIAIKVLNQHVASDPNWVQRFYNEAKACSRLTHPNTIRMFDFGQTSEGLLFMSMEFLDGQVLREAIDASAPMAPARVLKILIQCCASLAEAHSIGIIHRDIKPDNVFLLNLAGSPDFVKLLDFSVAKLLQDNERMRTQAGVVFGTPQYMSPEQGRGMPLDARSDLYALGILAFEMLTGRVPFNDENPMTVLQMHLRQPTPPLPEAVPIGVRTVVNKALEKDPNRRYQSATEMMQHCQHVFASLGAQSAGTPAPQPQQVQQAASYEQKTMIAGQAPDMAALRAQHGLPPQQHGGPPPQQHSGPPPQQHGGPPRQPHGGPPPPQHAGAAEKTMMAGQAPDLSAFRGMPPPAAAEQKTMIAGQAPDLAAIRAQQGMPPHSGGPPGHAGAAEKTMMAGQAPDLSALNKFGPPGAIQTVVAPDNPGGGPPPMPRADTGGAPQKTMMLENSEGIVSFAQRGGSAPVSAPGGEDTGAVVADGAGALFWVVCLVMGLVVGVGAYVLVLQLS